NIVDDYCALAAATELFRATHNPVYKAAADRRAHSLMSRLVSSGGYENYWRADNGTRPFFHASDAGFPAVSLLYYAEIADADTRREVLQTVRKSLEFQLTLDQEVNNPFDYARQLVQDKTGARRTSFFSRTTLTPLRGGRERTRGWHHWARRPVWLQRISRRMRHS